MGSFIGLRLFKNVEDDGQISKGKLGTQEVEHSVHPRYNFLMESRRSSDYQTRFLQNAAYWCGYLYRCVIALRKIVGSDCDLGLGVCCLCESGLDNEDMAGLEE